MIRRSRWVFAVVVLLAACGKNHDQKLPPATGSGAPPLPVLPAVARPTTAAPAASTSLRRSTGTLLPHAEVAVVSRARGVLVALTVDVGARIKRGQVLFRVDGRDADLRLAQARTQLAAAAQQLKSVEIEARRTKSLFDQQAASPQQWDQITAQVEAAKVGVAQAQNGVAVASKEVADTTALAPIAGVVVARQVALGDYVSDSPATRVLVVQDQATLDLKFRLPERALASVRVGDAITVALPALGLSRKAAISIVAPSVDARTRTVELTAVLDNADGALRPGLMADVELAGLVAANQAAPEAAKAAAK
ncbi:MAG: efflux RND transporter periplasmic adaptor subunit [Kofleriaceae bacterium]